MCHPPMPPMNHESGRCVALVVSSAQLYRFVPVKRWEGVSRIPKWMSQDEAEQRMYIIIMTVRILVVGRLQISVQRLERI